MQDSDFKRVCAQLTKGMTFSTASQVKKVLEYYVGTEKYPAPFGGRADQLKELNHWLNDPEMPRNLALVANAGRGKSALLANWAAELVIKRSDFYIIYFPINSRYDTNNATVVFNALAGRLGSMFNEEIHTMRPLDANSAKELYLSYLDRETENHEKVLIIIDGLDEVAGWEIGADLFPANTNDHLKILVAARSLAGDTENQYWLSSLGWDRPRYATQMDVNLLDINGVKEVLFKLGDPLAQLSFDYDVYQKLNELSEGDPLLLRLYVETLLKKEDDVATLTPKDLLDLKPGFASYFDHWFDDQRKIWAEQYKTGIITKNEFDIDQGVNDFFRILSFAKSPLTVDDVYGIGIQKFKDRDEIRRVVKYTNRFVVGDGKKNGFVFSHPRLGYYFADQLSKQEQDEYKELFFEYCDQSFSLLRKNSIKPEDISRYVVKNYTVHLKEKEADRNKFYALMCKEWLQAWELVDGTLFGFLSDVDLAWKKAVTEGPSGLGKQVFAALCFASVSSIGSNIPPDLLIQCIENKIINPQLGLVFAEREMDDISRVNKILKIFPYILDQKQKKILFCKVMELARRIEDEYDRVYALTEIARQVPEEKRGKILREVLELAGRIEDEYDRVHALTEIAGQVPEEERGKILRETLELAGRIEDKKDRVCALTGITEQVPEEERGKILREALELARRIEDEYDRVLALIGIVEQVPEEERGKILYEALELAGLIEEGILRVHALTEIAGQVPEEERGKILREVLELAGWIEDEAYWVEVLKGIAGQVPEEERGKILHEALELAGRIEDRNYRVHVLTEIARQVPEEERGKILREALELAGRIEDEYDRVHALTGITEQVPEEERGKILREVLELAGRIEDRNYRVHVLTEITKQVPEEERGKILREALELARRIEVEIFQVHALIEIAGQVPEEERGKILREALELAGRIEDELFQVYALTEIAGQVSEEERGKILREALELAGKIEKESYRVCALIEIAGQEPEEGRRKILREALKLARRIKDEKDRVYALIEIAGQVPEEERGKILREALELNRRIKGEKDRVYALIEIARQVPEEERGKILREALELNRRIEDENYQVHALTEIARQMPEEGSEEILREALELAGRIEDENGRVYALTKIAGQMPEEGSEEILREALELSTKIRNEEIKFDIKYQIFMTYLLKMEITKIDFCYLHKNAYRFISLTKNNENYLSLWIEMCNQLELSKLDEIEKVLRAICFYGRNETINVIYIFISQLYELGGSTIFAEIAEGIIEIGCLWSQPIFLIC